MKNEALSAHASARAVRRAAKRRERATRAKWAYGRPSRAPVSGLFRHLGKAAQVASRSVPLPWEATASAIPPGVSTAWCSDAVMLQAAVKSGAPFIVVPRGRMGAAILDAAAAKLRGGAAFTRITCPDGKPWSASEVATAILGGHADDENGERLVARVLAERSRAPHLLVAVDGADRLSPDALAFLQRLTEVRLPGAPAVQVAFPGGAEFYVLLAEERFHAIREEVRSEIGVEAEYAPNAPAVSPLTGRQRAGLAVGLMTVCGLLVGPFVPWKVLPAFGTRAVAPPVAVAQAVPTPPPEPVVLAAAPAPAEDMASVRARLRREFETSLAARGTSARRMSVVERERLFRAYMARQQVSLPHPIAAPADRPI